MNAVLGFVPPYGALQFELHLKQPRDGHGIPGAKMQDFMWVMPPIKNLMPCSCMVSYPIVLESLTPHNRKLAEDVLSRRRTILCACSCQGQVIE